MRLAVQGLPCDLDARGRDRTLHDRARDLGDDTQVGAFIDLVQHQRVCDRPVRFVVSGRLQNGRAADIRNAVSTNVPAIRERIICDNSPRRVLRACSPPIPGTGEFANQASGMANLTTGAARTKACCRSGSRLYGSASKSCCFFVMRKSTHARDDAFYLSTVNN